MNAAMIAARKCVAWIASEEELGDLEEVGHSVSRLLKKSVAPSTPA